MCWETINAFLGIIFFWWQESGFQFSSPLSTCIDSGTSSCQANYSFAQRLAEYLKDCVERIPEKEFQYAPNDVDLCAEHPGTASGKHIRCLAEHPETSRVGVFFYGYPGPNGVLSAALGLRAQAHRAAGNGSQNASRNVLRLLTAEADSSRCAAGKRYLRAMRLEDYVDLKCRIVCHGISKADCLAEFRELFCPHGRLDLAAVDFSLALHPQVYQSLLEVCAPKIVFVENSGLHWWIHDSQEEDSFSNYSERMPDSWHHFEENLHQAALEGRGPFRLAIDRRPSGICEDHQGDVVSIEDVDSQHQRIDYIDHDPRYFSIYVSADEA